MPAFSHLTAGIQKFKIWLLNHFPSFYYSFQNSASSECSISNFLKLSNQNFSAFQMRTHCATRECSRRSRIKVIVQWGQFNLFSSSSFIELFDSEFFLNSQMSQNEFQKRFTSICKTLATEERSFSTCAHRSLFGARLSHWADSNSGKFKASLKNCLKFLKVFDKKFTCLSQRRQLMELLNINVGISITVIIDYKSTIRQTNPHPFCDLSLCRGSLSLSLIFNGPFKELTWLSMVKISSVLAQVRP